MGTQQLFLRPRSPPVAIATRTASRVSNVNGDSGTETTATATYALVNDGTVLLNTVTPVDGEWLVRGIVADYEVRMSQVSGATIGGSALATWIDGATGGAWAVSATQFGVGSTNNTGVGTAEIRRKSDSTVVATATITISATATVNDLS